MCSPCGPMVCYKYEDCGPPLQCLPRSAFKRNGLQDCQFFQQGSIRYLCRADCCCPRPCPPCCPPCVRRPPPGKTYKGKSSDRGARVEEEGEEKKDEKENQLKRTKSRELRGGIMYYSCHCIKRNGLQHDCRRTGCGGEPACLVLPDPLCAPSQLARARGLADPAALAAHTHSQGGAGSGGPADSGSGSGKKFIVCELKGILPDVSMDRTGKCCKCPPAFVVPPTKGPISGSAKPQTHACICTGGKVPMKTPVVTPASTKCTCNCGHGYGSSNIQPPTVIELDDKMIGKILKAFETKEVASAVKTAGPGGRSRDATKSVPKEEPCTRLGCIHWQPPPPCVWDLPCKADCFETPPSVQPGRNPLTSGGGGGFITVVDSPGRNTVSKGGGAHQPRERMKLLMPECCTGCSAPSDGGAMASGGPAAGLPLLVMKLC